VSFYKQARFWTLLVAVIVGLGIVQQIWHWEVERIEVPPGKFLVRIHRWGKNLEEGEIIAKDASYKGVMLDVLPEGRHFLNPIFWSYEVQELEYVPPGQCLVLTRMFGKPIDPKRLLAGDTLAREDERGIVADVLVPGSYRLNRYAYQWTSEPAREVKVNQVGVRTLKVGKDPSQLAASERSNPYTVPEGFRGVQDKPLPPGTYYINPYVETIDPIDIRSHRVGLGDIEFPSRDGFIIKPYVVVEYAVRPESASQLLVRITDEGILHQGDSTPEEQQANEVLQKVILPHIRGYARIEGSNFDARDFILTAAEPEDVVLPAADGAPKPADAKPDDAAKPDEAAKPDTPATTPPVKPTNAREVLQKALLSKVKPRCSEMGVDVRAVTLADMRPPDELSDQISQRELARVEREKNVVRLRQYQAEQELRAKEALKQQAREKVEAETRVVQAKTKASQMLEVEESRLKQDLTNAQVTLDAARQQAEATLAHGRADAAVIQLQNEATVSGLQTAVDGFGSAQQFAQYQILSRLGPAISEIFASDDSEFARLVAEYMTTRQPPANDELAPPTIAPATVPVNSPAAEPTVSPAVPPTTTDAASAAAPPVVTPVPE
jgi:regulator of protease activity HflC (stomatin/prohibitin superfamily)